MTPKKTASRGHDVRIEFVVAAEGAHVGDPEHGTVWSRASIERLAAHGCKVREVDGRLVAYAAFNPNGEANEP